MIRTVLLPLIFTSICMLMVVNGFAQIKNDSRATNRINLRQRDNTISGEAGQPGQSVDNDENTDRPLSSQDLQRTGPANIPFNLADLIESDYDFTGENILDVFNTIYRDQNIYSGYYYYLPASYNLSWREESGQYDFNANYGTAGEEGLGKTTVTAILTPNLSTNELKLVEYLLLNDIKGKPEEKFGITDMVPMPLANTSEVEFTNLGQFDVGENDISIRAPSDLLEPIYISFTTSRIDDLMAMFFNNIGLFGDIVIYPSGENMPNSIRIPFNLKIDDAKTFGRFELNQDNWRKGWQNRTDYPLKLTHLHVMKMESGGLVKVFSWETGNKEVPENAHVEFDASAVPYWIDTHPDIEKVWLGYMVLPCRSCNANVKEKIIKGTSGSRIQNIEFTILTPLDFTGAGLMKIKIRSYQADPNGNSKRNLASLTLTEDGQVLSGGQLYVPEGDDPEFEYLLQLYMEDGTKYEANRWVKSNDLEVVVGKKQVQDLFNNFN